MATRRRNVRLRYFGRCANCHGSGRAEEGHACTVCGGTGETGPLFLTYRPCDRFAEGRRGDVVTALLLIAEGLLPAARPAIRSLEEAGQ